MTLYTTDTAAQRLAGELADSKGQGVLRAEFSVLDVESVLAALPIPATGEDERIEAWDAIARHPFFRDCYATDGTLLAAMLAKLNGTVPATAHPTAHQFDIAADAYYNAPVDSTLNEQGNRRVALVAAFRAAGIEVTP